jgi:predicted small secreted protein
MRTTRIASLALAFAVLGLGACNTVEGFGQDVEEGGENLSNAADNVEQEIEN